MKSTLRVLALLVCACVVLPAQVTVRNGMSYTGTYSSGSTYAKGDVVLSSTGLMYLSLVGSNIGNTPGGAASAADWQFVAASTGALYAAGGGSANAQTATYTPAILSLAVGQAACWLPTAANTTTTPTFAPNGLTAKTITKFGASPLGAGDLTTTAIACSLYDGTEWQLQNPQAVASTGTVTSVSQTVPPWLTVTGSPLTTSGTLAIAPATGQTSHQVIGTCGSATSFAPCPLVAGDLPSTLTPSSVLATGIVDGTAPVTLTTGTTATLGGTYNSGYTFNQEATAATAVTYTLPTAAAGKQYCTSNSYNGSAATTGVLTIAASASGQFIIFTDGTLSATGGNVASGGAGGDAACFVGVDSTHWQMYVQQGTWTKH